MKKVKINGLSELQVNIFLGFMKDKLTDKGYVSSIEMSGNDCDMLWFEDGLDISGEDMVHELFLMYGEESLDSNNDDVYKLEIGDYIFTTWKSGEDWYDEYECYIDALLN